MICWSEDQDTGCHDHEQSTAGIAVDSGRVREERLAGDFSTVARELGAGSMFSVPAAAIHRVAHASRVPTIAIHA